MEDSLLVLAIIGAVTTLKLSGVVNGWVTVAVAIVLGIVAGIGQVEGLNVFTGLLTGLSALGVATVADRIAKS